MREADKLPEPILTLATEVEQGLYDENVSVGRVADLVGSELAQRVRDTSLRLYRFAADRGLIIADAEFEFGLLSGELVLVGEALTPDSSRSWPAETYWPGGPQPSFDKQHVRDYLIRTGWDKAQPPPELPVEVVQKTTLKCRDALRRLTRRIDRSIVAPRTVEGASMSRIGSRSMLKRELSLLAVFCIAAGAMISSGRFVLPGLAFAKAGPAMILSYAMAGLLVVPSVLSKAELATAMPKAGGHVLLCRTEPWSFARRSHRPLGLAVPLAEGRVRSGGDRRVGNAGVPWVGPRWCQGDHHFRLCALCCRELHQR